MMSEQRVHQKIILSLITHDIVHGVQQRREINRGRKRRSGRKERERKKRDRRGCDTRMGASARKQGEARAHFHSIR
jgi:hypothetical protein